MTGGDVRKAIDKKIDDFYESFGRAPKTIYLGWEEWSASEIEGKALVVIIFDTECCAHRVFIVPTPSRSCILVSSFRHRYCDE
jgi:hypothetical protein